MNLKATKRKSIKHIVTNNEHQIWFPIAILFIKVEAISIKVVYRSCIVAKKQPQWDTILFITSTLNIRTPGEVARKDTLIMYQPGDYFRSWPGGWIQKKMYKEQWIYRTKRTKMEVSQEHLQFSGWFCSNLFLVSVMVQNFHLVRASSKYLTRQDSNRTLSVSSSLQRIE